MTAPEGNVASSYDDVPYTSYAYARTHPDRLCTIARLFGLEPAQPQRCRVLELGCGSGGNLLPMAALFPYSTFVGIDASATQVREAESLRDAAALDNVRVTQTNILDVDDDWGEFDYIICHGVFSWVGREVQDKILAIVRRNLAPQGIGYISYNVYPGWHMREMVRHMMRYHVRRIASPPERVRQARALVDFLAQSVAETDDAFAALLQRELDLLKTTGNDYVFHEHLEEVNTPIYFHEFAERLRAHDLAYVGETDLHTMMVRQYAPAVSRTLERVAPDIESMEQYMDFVRNRQFRATVVSRAGATFRRRLTPDLLRGFAVEFAGVQDATPVDLLDGIHHEFKVSEHVTVGTQRSITKAALVALRAHWPCALRFPDLLRVALSLLDQAGITPSEQAEEQLASDLLECCFGAAGVQLRSWSPPVAARPPSKPRVTRLAREQAARYHRATTLRHVDLHLDRGPAAIVGLLDGTRNCDAIVECLADLVADGKLELTHNGKPLTERASMREPLHAVLDSALAHFARNALLLSGNGERHERDP